MWQVYAGIAAANALAQWLNSESARTATAEERRRIEQLYQDIQAPNFDPASIKPEDYKIVGEYIPEVAQFIQEQAPETIGMSPDMIKGREAQLSALDQLRSIARVERDPALAAALEGASQQAQAEAQSRQNTLLQNYARRGQLGAPQMLAAQLGAGSDAMNRLAEEGRAAAIESYRNRMGALQNSANLGGNIFSADVGMQSKNADIINAFNQRAASRAQDYGQYRAGIMNAAQAQNLREKQRIADANTGLANKYKMDINDIQQKNFQNKMDVAAGKAGLARERISDVRSNAQDYGNAIQGAADIGMTGYGAYSDEQRRADDRKWLEEQYQKDREAGVGHTYRG